MYEIGSLWKYQGRGMVSSFQGSFTGSCDFLDFCIFWVSGHILGTKRATGDVKMARFSGAFHLPVNHFGKVHFGKIHFVEETLRKLRKN